MGAYGDSHSIRNMLAGLLNVVHIQPPSPSEQQQILAASFPALPQEAVLGCMAALQLCQIVGGQQTAAEDRALGVAGAMPAWQEGVERAMARASLAPGELATRFGRHFSLRNLFKLCQRLQVF